jgi:hypothetical protein
MAYGTINADQIGTSVAGSNLGAGNASIMKNRIINGAMVIDQRNAGASVNPTSGSFVYTVDRWTALQTQSSKLTVQQNAGSVTPPAGFTNYLGVTSSSAYSLISSDQFLIGQYIEGYNTSDLTWGTANAKTITLSFQVYSSLTGTFGGALQNSAQSRSYPFTYSIPTANTWTSISITITGCTDGVWQTTTSTGITVFLGLGVGSTKSGAAGSWQAADYRSATGATSVVGTNGATFYITGVQLEVGSIATGFEYRNYQQELALCQRYLPAFNASNSTQNPFMAYVQSTNYFRAAIPFKVSTRTPPTGITVVSPTSFAVSFYGSGQNCTSVTFVYAGTESAAVEFAVSSAALGSVGQPYANANGCQILFTGCEL